MKPEARFKKLMREFLDSEGIYSVPYIATTIGQAGTPDRLACVTNAFVGIEFKASLSNKPTKVQIAQLKKMTDSGGCAFVVRPESFENFKYWIRYIADPWEMIANLSSPEESERWVAHVVYVFKHCSYYDLTGGG
jgi:hypothetical protein